jgi:hypothetical protein
MPIDRCIILYNNRIILISASYPYSNCINDNRTPFRNFKTEESDMALTRKHFIPISPRQANFDHADVYRCESPANSRLYVAHTGVDRIEIIDCSSNRYVRSLPDVPGVAGILINSKQDFLFLSDRGCARVSIYRCSDEKLLGRVTVGDRPNGLAYDPERRHLVVFNIGDPPGVNCTTSVVAIDETHVIKNIPLPGRPRWAVYDAATDHVYANIREPAQIIGLSAIDLRITRAFPVPVAGPHGLVIAGERLFCAADGATLVALHRDTGAVLGSVALPGAPECCHARSGVGSVVCGLRIAWGYQRY